MKDKEIENKTPAKSRALGKKLLKARRQKGYSLKDVASRLNLRPELLRRIERGNFGQDATFTGFVRGYAAFLGVETKKVASETRRHKIPEELPVSRRGERFSVFSKVAALVLLALAYLGWNSYLEGGTDREDPPPVYEPPP